jgi:DNA-binding protein HU-beta
MATTKAQLIASIQASIEGTKKQAEAALSTVIETIKKDLSKEGRIAISGLGTFSVIERAARVGRNPATGAELKIKAAKKAKFKAAPDLTAAAEKFKKKK